MNPADSLTFDEYHQLVEQAPFLIWRADLTMGCNYFNDRWLAFTGRTLAQEYANGWAEGVHPDEFARCLDIYQNAFSKREIFEMEYRLRRFDGVFRWIFDRGVPFNDTEGNFAGYIGSCIDVTERVEAQEALRKAQEAEVRRLRQLLPICSSCHKVRDDEGYWGLLENYMHQHSDIKFTHGLCPDCLRKLFPEAYAEVEADLSKGN
jgi:PAS domain S-box-containing protein